VTLAPNALSPSAWVEKAIGNEGAIFMTYYAEQSCTAGRNAFFTGMHPLRTGLDLRWEQRGLKH